MALLKSCPVHVAVADFTVELGYESCWKLQWVMLNVILECTLLFKSHFIGLIYG